MEAMGGKKVGTWDGNSKRTTAAGGRTPDLRAVKPNHRPLHHGGRCLRLFPEPLYLWGLPQRVLVPIENF